MVINKAIRTVQRELEKFLIKENRYKLEGVNYEFMLLRPIASSYSEKYSWLVSASIFDTYSERSFIHEVLKYLKGNLAYDTRCVVSSIGKVETNGHLAEDLNNIWTGEQEYFEIDEAFLGNREFENAILIRPVLLNYLVEGHTISLSLKDHKNILANIISIDENFYLKYYTSAALEFAKAESFEALNSMPCKELCDKGYVKQVHLDDIEQVHAHYYVE